MKNPERKITPEEYRFLRRIEGLIGGDLLQKGLTENCTVEPMSDGGMGSLRFPDSVPSNTNRRLGEVFAQGEFDDHDGVTVSFAINMDIDGRLFELDLWRVDFDPLKKIPTENDEIRLLVTDPE